MASRILFAGTALAFIAAPLAAQSQVPAETPAARDPLLLPGDDAPPALERMLRPPRPQPPGGQPPAPVDTTPSPSLDYSQSLSHAIIDACSAQGLHVGVAVTDAQGALRFALNTDGTAPGRIFTAARKGAAVIAFGLPTKAIQTKLRTDTAARSLLKPYMAIYPGGEPIVQDGKLIGAVAASGGTAEQDDACVLAGLAATASPQATTGGAVSPEQVQLLAAEDARFAAQVAKDVGKVEAGLADELVYVHAVGRRQTKADYLAALASGRADYRSITATQRVSGVSGTLGWTRATLTNVVGDRTLKSSYLAVYTRRGGRWQLLSWQTTPDPSDMPPGPQGPPPAPTTTPKPSASH